MHLLHHPEHYHVRQIYLHAYPAQVFHNLVVQHNVSRTYGVNKPKGEECQLCRVRQKRRGYIVPKNKIAYRKNHHRDTRPQEIPLRECCNLPAVKIGQSTGHEQWSTKHHVLTVYRGKMNQSNKHKHQSRDKREPCPAFVVKQEHEKGKQHVEQKYHTKEPTHTYYIYLDIRRQQTKT